MENQTTKKSTMIHKENNWEWKFVGIYFRSSSISA